MNTEEPRVTVGLPVRNGEATLGAALESLLAQTYRKIEVVICDNASTDATPRICQDFMDRDARVRYLRHDSSVPVMKNWEIAYRQANAPYFMWAADDDLRSENFVEVLLRALEEDKEAGLAFGRVEKFLKGRPETSRPFPYECNTRGLPIWKRLWMDKHGPFAPYGLFRTSVLEDYRWYDHTVSPDWPLFIYVLVRTEIIQVPEAVFFYAEGVEPVSATARAKNQALRPMETYPTARLSWWCAHASRDAAREKGKDRILIFDFVVVFLGILWSNRRSLVRWALKRGI